MKDTAYCSKCSAMRWIEFLVPPSSTGGVPPVPPGKVMTATLECGHDKQIVRPDWSE